MDSELNEICQEFFEESLEHLEKIESILLNCEEENLSKDELDAIFRCVHSIKGGCGMFDFTHLANFSHNFENLMDEIRQGERALSGEIFELMIESNDVIKKGIEALRAGDESEQSDAKLLNEKIIQLMGQDQIEAPIKPKVVENKVDSPADPDVSVQEEKKISSDDKHQDNSKKKENVTQVEDRLPEIEEIDFDALAKEVAEKQQATSQSNNSRTPEVANKGNENKVEKKPVVQQQIQTTDSIRIVTHKIDSIINQVGELVITKSMLTQRYKTLNSSSNSAALLQQSLLQLEHNVREIQESIMDFRMVPIESVFKRFPRLVRDLSKRCNKNIDLVITGGETEIDKNMVEKLIDPLVHLMRNAIDHGIESTDVRSQKEKSETGTIELRAYHKGGAIAIDIIDDGKGMDPNIIKQKSIDKGLINTNDNLTEDEIFDLIFEPGFSTAEEISDISGRGVGMDVVKRNIQELGGSIEISSKVDRGSCFSVRLPLTLSIIDGQLFKVDDQIYIIPITSIIELIQIEPGKIKHIAGKDNEVHEVRDHYIPIVRLHDVIASNHPQPEIENVKKSHSEGLLIVVEAKKKRVGLHVHELLSQQQVVMKSLEENFRRVKGIPAATILGDGKVALIVDVDGLYELALQTKQHSKHASQGNGANAATFNREGVTNV